MIDRVFRFLSVEIQGLHTAVYILAASALLSSLLALVRDRLLAHTFGAGTELDLYYAAFRIPDLIFVATGALVSVYILIPELARRDAGAQKKYIDTVIVAFSILAVVVSGGAALFAPFVLAHLFPQFVLSGLLPTLVTLTRIMLLQPILLGFSNILAAITQSRARYALYAMSPLLYNLGIIAGITVLYPVWGITGLAYGVILGAALHVGIQIPSVLADGFFHSLPRLWEPRVLLETAAISVPRALALSMNQLTFIGLTALAATLATGSIAVFMFAFNLQAVPLAIIGASYSVAAFPALARAIARGAHDEFVAHIAAAARYIFFWSLPAVAFIIVLRAHLVRVILGSGAFDWTDTRLTAAAFALLSLSLVSQGLMLLLVRGYYAAGRTFVPFIVSVFTALGTVVVGALLVGVFKNQFIAEFTQSLLRVADVPGSTVLALAFAYSGVSIAGAVILVFHFNRRFNGFVSQSARAFWESVVAAVAGGGVAYIALALIGPITFASTTLSVFARGFTAGVLGVIASACAYYLLGSTEFRETLEAVHARLWRSGITTQGGVAVVASAEEGTPTSPQ
jgi:putative peptidoglycan lipid II flippase